MMGTRMVKPLWTKVFLMNKADALWYPDTFISNSIDHKDRESFSGDPHEPIIILEFIQMGKYYTVK